MIGESNFAITMVTLCDWLEHLTPVFQPMKSKTETYCLVHLVRAIFSRHELEIMARNSDWFIALFVPILIGRRINCLIGYSTVI